MIEIQSLREAFNKSYTRPDISKVAQFESALRENPTALDYLHTKRGLTDETIQHFHLGYSAQYDAIAIPVFKSGELVNIKYRFLNPTEAKYIGEKDAESWLYNDTGIKLGAKKGRILIVEGEFDLMCAWQSGVQNVISPASGKNSYGAWIELLDKIPKVYVAYDNDRGGRETALEMAERIGTDKCFDVKYPEGIKDANEYTLSHTSDEFRALINQARPYYTRQFKGITDIIDSLRNRTEDALKIPFIPKVEIEKDWLIVVSGKSNVGKTSYALNITDFLAENGIPTLFMPFERGIESVGKRLLQVMFDKTIAEFRELSDSEWDRMLDKSINSPVYFALPKKTDIVETIVKANRLFGTKVVIVDHLDYIVRDSTGSKESAIGQTLQELKRVAEENGIIMIIITHIRKIDNAGSLLAKKPGIEDLKGSASLYQDPECVIMLDGDGKTTMKVDVVKNKGLMGNRDFVFNESTGRLSMDELFDEFD